MELRPSWVDRSYSVDMMQSKSVTLRFKLGACLLALALSSTAAAQASAQQEVYGLLQAHQFVQAEAAARSYLNASANDCSVRTMLGLALRGEGKLIPAFEAFRTSTKLCPRFLPPLEGAAEIAYAQKMPEAEEILKQVLTLNPNEPTTHAMLGALEAKAGNCETAVAHYASAGDLVQRNPPALREYAGCLVSLGRGKDAVVVSSRLIAVEDTAANRMLLAEAQRSAGNREEALSAIQPLTGPDSHNGTALLLAAKIAEDGGDSPKAIAWLRQAIQVSPKLPDPYLYFAELSFNHGSYQVGIDVVNVGLHNIPADARLLVARGVLEVQVARMDAALADFEEAHKTDPKLSFAEDAMGMLFSQKNDASAALAMFERESNAHPRDPLVQYLYAEALSEDPQNNDTKTVRAVQAARRAVDLEPSYLPARDLLCVLLLRRGDYVGAIEQANEATRRDPFDEVVLYQEMLAERKLSHLEAARQLAVRLQQAKNHNKATKRKYVLEEAGNDRRVAPNEPARP